MLFGFDIPYYWYFVIFGALAFTIYSFLSLELKYTIKKWLNEYWAIVFIFFLWIYWRQSTGFFTEGEWMARKSNTYLVLVFLIYSLANMFIGRERYATPQFVAENLHGSIADNPIKTENGFLIFSIGGQRATAWYFPKGNKIAVIREETGQFLSDNFVSIARMKRINKQDYPPEVQAELKKNWNFNGIDECYYGWFDSQREEDWAQEELEKLDKMQDSPELHKLIKSYLSVGNPRIGDLVLLCQNISATYNKLDEHFKDVTTEEEKYVGHIDRIRERVSPKRETRIIEKRGKKGDDDYD